MELYEFEGKSIFKERGIPTSRGFEVSDMNGFEERLDSLVLPAVIKAQVLSGKRAETGGIQFINTKDELEEGVRSMFGRIVNGETVRIVRIEEAMGIAHEYYVSFSYDERLPVVRVLFSGAGGTGIEGRQSEETSLTFFSIDPTIPLDENKLGSFLIANGLGELALPKVIGILKQCFVAFIEGDMKLLEINPLAETSNGKWLAIDAKVVLDDAASFRHPEWEAIHIKRNDLLSPASEKANDEKTRDAFYYRGTIGLFRPLGGTIGVLLSGGGASLACMDALMAAGGKPANYAEYSGNPPREKVFALARQVLAEPGLTGLWIAGGFANFTRIDETLGGIVDALREVRPKYPIVVRRAGPNDKEGQVMFEAATQELGLDLTFFGRETKMSESAHIISKKALAWETERAHN